METIITNNYEEQYLGARILEQMEAALVELCFGTRREELMSKPHQIRFCLPACSLKFY